jgi:alginate O-acetyltransferase complex protein AlgI
MLFNSISFALFLPIVLFLYWLFPSKKIRPQNILILIASYYFYANWDWRFLFLLVFSTVLDYVTGIKMHDSTNKKLKSFWFWTSIIINTSFLGLFKYYNFFVDNFAELLSFIGFQINYTTLQVILPVGISFYTFHGLSYVIDIYFDKIKPERNFVDYSLFVSYFPLLVAGPIERATHLLPQLKVERKFNYHTAVEGFKQILWGLFKKVVIADSCATYANQIFNNSTEHNGSTLFVGAIFFAIQIYGDFSGYSDIALGVSKLFGIELLRNFAYPYFSRDIAEFWRRWHISLSSWFKDYLYKPLGGSKRGMSIQIRNTFIIFLVSGFWHGANWTFIIWGALNAIYILPSIILKSNRNNLEIVAKGKILPNLKDTFNILITFLLATLAWIFFRSENIQQSLQIISQIFSPTFFSLPEITGDRILKILLLLFLIIEWFGRESDFAISKNPLFRKSFFRWTFYVITLLAVEYYSGQEQQFIYFQF